MGIQDAICIQLEEHALGEVYQTWASAARNAQRTTRKEVRGLRKQLQESTTTQTAKILEAQLELKLRMSYSGWKEIYKSKKYSHLHLRYVTKTQETSKRMFGMLLAAQFEVLLKACFASWCQKLTEQRQDAELQRQDAELRGLIEDNK